MINKLVAVFDDLNVGTFNNKRYDHIVSTLTGVKDSNGELLTGYLKSYPVFNDWIKGTRKAKSGIGKNFILALNVCISTHTTKI